MTRLIVGTRDQVRAALDELVEALNLPRFDGGSSHSRRYARVDRLPSSQWCAEIKPTHESALSAPLAALVLDASSLPIVRRSDPTYRASLPLWAQAIPAADLSPLHEIVSSTWWMRPWIVRAEIVDLPQDVPTESGVEHLWDTSEPDLVGMRYLRADGQREFVLQQIGNTTDHVFALWFAGASDDPNETNYARAMIGAATALGVVLESVECSYVDGAWIVDEMAEGSTIASRWPADWRVWQPGDVALPTGPRCVREVVL